MISRTLQLQICESEAMLDTMPEPQGWLSPSELQRLDGLRAPKRRAHYLAGHWLARQMLADALRGSSKYAAEFPLLESPDQAPLPDTREACGWQLSISHSQQWIGCAIAPFAIGLDLEQRRARPSLLSMRHLLSLQPEDGTPDADELLLRWVAKESWIKLHQGSALPEQLLAIQLKARDAETAPIRVLSTSDWHLGLAAAAMPEQISLPHAGTWRYFGV